MPNINFQLPHDDRERERFVEIIRFVRSRIPPEDRQCWSVYRAHPVRTSQHDWWSPMRRTISFWFAERYAWVGVEMKIHFG